MKILWNGYEQMIKPIQWVQNEGGKGYWDEKHREKEVESEDESGEVSGRSIEKYNGRETRKVGGNEK